MFRLMACGLAVTFTLWAEPARADSECRFVRHGRSLLLSNDCTTTRTIEIPDGFTLDGRGHRITATDPAGDHFRGAIVRNAGARARVRNLQLNAEGLADRCDGGADGLRGILFDGASGTIEQSVVSDLNQGESGCQEGQAIEVRNDGRRPSRVTIRQNVVERYQKTGIVIIGKVRATVRDNVVTGQGPVAYIAQNGIQIGWGAKATVSGNAVSNNSYTGVGEVAVGILLVGGPGHACLRTPCEFSRGSALLGNVVVDNDVGIALENRELDGVPALQPTRNTVRFSTVANETLTNGSAVQVGILGIGNGDRIEHNVVVGDGYDPSRNPGAVVEPILAEPPYSVGAELRDNQSP